MKNYLFILGILGAFLINSCASVDPCPPNKTEGNVGSLFNTELDEYSPIFFENSLYYTALQKENNQPEQIYRSEYIKNQFTSPVSDNSLPIGDFKNGGLPQFFFNKERNRLELYFAGKSKNKKKEDSEIYYSFKINNKWIEPLPMVSINSSGFESYPAISPDGKTLLFVSERADGYGKLDIYISKRQTDGSWGKPENLGPEINTVEDDKTPFIDKSGNLYFASKGYPGFGKYDIIKATATINGWNNAKAMGFPVNTEANEAGPAIYNNQIFFDSDRRGGCGGKDLYIFDLCGPVFLDGSVVSEMKGMPLTGKVRLSDELNKEIATLDVNETGKFSLNLEGGKRYRLQYFNSCSPDYLPEQSILAECNDTVAVRYYTKFVITGNEKEFDFSEYKVPFFVSGYYMPNTRNNLESLRMKFSYNLLGADSSSRYIENPGEEYDNYFETVENALNDAADFILNIVNNIKDDCRKNTLNTLRVKVNGFADPRPISPNAVYLDESILDEQFGLDIQKGSQMTNELLSLLRAYYTAKYLTNHISNSEQYTEIADKIKWEIGGNGIDGSEKDNKFKRRVNIVIGVEKKD